MVYFSTGFLDFLSVTDGRVAKILYHYYAKRYPAYRFIITADKVNFIANGCFEAIHYLPASKSNGTTIFPASLQ
jgi:hypothetical protein